jgi:phospholipid/cholesterol/gamma-HCH transport system permease protein
MALSLKMPALIITEKVKTLSEGKYAESLTGFFEEVASVSLFTLRFFKELFRKRYEFTEIVRQSYIIGYKSIPLVSITGFILGLVFTIQSRPTLVEFGAESWLPAMVTISMFREISPVVIALIFAGKVGSGIGAELASMKVTEQVEAMEVSGINPFKYLAVTRIVAATIMLPVLVIIADGVSLYGTFVGVNIKGDVSFSLFFLQVIEKLSFQDIFPSVLKTFCFGFAISLIACYKGLNAKKGTEGVGEAANTSVVQGSLAVFIIDLVAVQLTSLLL